MPRKYIAKKLREDIRTLANYRCEYCKSLEKYSPQSFNIEHIFPISLKGKSTKGNLAFSCGGCNSHKYNKTTGIDKITGGEVRLFNPRKQKWKDHFEWDEDYLNMIGKTATGRVTIFTLHLNREQVVNHRELVKLTSEHP